MATQLALSDREGHALIERRDVTPMELIQSAIMQGASIDTIERLTKLQREMVEYEAKVGFNEALHRAQTKMRRISADATNPQTKSRYASYPQLDRVLRPLYTEEGIALSFDTVDCPINEHVRVVCDVSRGGYTKRYQIDMPADGKGAKGGDVMTKTHAMGAGVAYGMRYLLKMIFNVAVGEDDKDGNDPNGAGDSVPMVEAEVIKYLDWIDEAGNVEDLQKYYLNAVKLADEAKDDRAKNAFVEAKNKRYRQLKGGSK
jgi:ERF superfamily